ncbi:MAG: hypothetical protein WCO21_03140 [bacterium]|nr:hypothetical protein [Candidatus Jorgensenbacteria bacterium]
MGAVERIAKILRTDKDFVYAVEKRLSSVTGKGGVFEKIIFENDARIKDRLERLRVPNEARAKDVYDALISKVESHDSMLCSGTGINKCSMPSDFERTVEIAKKVAKIPKGYFMKMEKAAELLMKEPPRRILAYLKYETVDEMLAKEDIIEVLAALRFVEGSDWLNSTFFPQYASLTPDDFEERDVEIRALSEKWNKYAKIFVMKKWHNVSHLKEFGILFVIPVSLGISGELLRMLNLIFHYTHEIPFYSDIFRKIAEKPETFSENLQSLLRGDTLDKRYPDDDKSNWLVIQRYLAKEDENDWRLFVPHINPEALHWSRAEDDLEASANELGRFGHELRFWNDLDWVGDYFRDESGNNVLVSFDLVDTVMGLVKKHERVKFLYHHQEALWNKIFIEYFGEPQLEEYAKSYILKGHFEI